MVTEILIRFLIGGAIVSVFAVIGDVLKPKSFAGLFGAAPSVALATLSLTIAKEGKAYASVEARSMILGAIAFFVYAGAASYVLMRAKWSALWVATLSLSLWLGASFILWLVFVK